MRYVRVLNVVVIVLVVDTMHRVVTRDALLLKRCESEGCDFLSGRGGHRGRGDGGRVRGGGERQREVAA